MRHPIGTSALVLAVVLTATLLPAAAQETVAPQTLGGATVQGAPGYDTLARAGYVIWADGEEFQIRWVTRGPQRSFSGQISTDGRIVDVRPHNVEPGELYRMDDRTIGWNARARGGGEGASFRVQGRWVRFALYIDGALARPQQIFLGRGGVNPPGNPITFLLGDQASRDRWPAMYRGQPDLLGRTAGFFVWYDDGGWHVRWHFRNEFRDVSGLISTDGRLYDVRRHSFEGDDVFAQSGRLIAWDTRTAAGVDGVDFKVNGDRLEFTFLLEGQLAPPSMIHVGDRGMRLGRNPFRVSR